MAWTSESGSHEERTTLARWVAGVPGDTGECLQMAPTDRRALLDRYRQGPDEVRQAIPGIEASLLDGRPAIEEWSIREIVHHVVDAEVMAAARLRRLVAEERPAIEPYDESEFARRLHYGRPIDSALDLLAASRRANADLLEQLGADAWSLAGEHPQLGRYSIEYLVQRAAAHCSEHAAQIRSTFAAVAPDFETRQDSWMERLKREGQAGFREYQLRVEVAEIRPTIWRRLVVPDTTGLPALHRVIQVAFGWQDYHMHLFEVGTARFGEPDQEYEPPPIDEKHVRIFQLVQTPGDRCRYEYDFGDSWWHEILLEDMWAAPEGRHPVRCTDGERAAPPEDCGGTGGYELLVAALADPVHPEHGEFRTWAGRFSPERFDREAINRKLARLSTGRRPSRRH